MCLVMLIGYFPFINVSVIIAFFLQLYDAQNVNELKIKVLD